MSILGNRVQRREDPKFLTVGGTYVADLDLPGSVHLTFVRSSMAHASIQAIDTSGAVTMPGVLAVYTQADLGLGNLAPILDMTPVTMTRSVLASGTVRYVGEPIVAIVAETRQASGGCHRAGHRRVRTALGGHRPGRSLEGRGPALS